jgi:hypothetical protein
VKGSQVFKFRRTLRGIQCQLGSGSPHEAGVRARYEGGIGKSSQSAWLAVGLRLLRSVAKRGRQQWPNMASQNPGRSAMQYGRPGSHPARAGEPVGAVNAWRVLDV